MIRVARWAAIKSSPGRSWRLLGHFLVVALALFLAAGAAFAHGSHARILLPAEGDEVCNSVKLHVQKTVHPFPYVGVEIRSDSDETLAWSGIVPLAEDGYSVEIDLEGWVAGRYIFEIKLLGDLVEQVQKRSFVVTSSRCS